MRFFVEIGRIEEGDRARAGSIWWKSDYFGHAQEARFVDGQMKHCAVLDFTEASMRQHFHDMSVLHLYHTLDSKRLQSAVQCMHFLYAFVAMHFSNAQAIALFLRFLYILWACSAISFCPGTACWLFCFQSFVVSLQHCLLSEFCGQFNLQQTVTTASSLYVTLRCSQSW